MKTTTTLKKIASITGLALGAFALSAFASSAWVAPLTPPPNPNVDAPINVGTSPQSKNAGLGVGQATMRAGTQKLDVFGTALIDNVITNSIQVVTGAGAGKVLTSNATGLATWQDATTTVTAMENWQSEFVNCSTDGVSKTCENQNNAKICFQTVMIRYDGVGACSIARGAGSLSGKYYLQVNPGSGSVTCQMSCLR